MYKLGGRGRWERSNNKQSDEFENVQEFPTFNIIYRKMIFCFQDNTPDNINFSSLVDLHSLLNSLYGTGHNSSSNQESRRRTLLVFFDWYHGSREEEFRQNLVDKIKYGLMPPNKNN